LSVSGSSTGTEGSTATLSSRFQVTNCAALAFKPNFTVTTSAKTSRTAGAGLKVKLTYPNGSLGTQANLHSVKVSLPRQLPSRLTTLQRACPDRVFDANPAACATESRVGIAKATTPILPVPLEGPAYFVSHGGAKFPELIMVLQGYGFTIYLHGETYIDEKTSVTTSTFPAVPDQPISSFELELPQGPYSALAAPGGNLCVAGNLAMPTSFTAQNAATLHQSTPIEVQGCPYKLTVKSHTVQHHTLTLQITTPAAGQLTAHARGLRPTTKNATRRTTLTLQLHKSKPGTVHTRVLLTFTPNSGKQRRILHTTITVRIP
jgi:hypothetical protein